MRSRENNRDILRKRPRRDRPECLRQWPGISRIYPPLQSFSFCVVFIVAIAVPIYSLVIEEKVAFDFTGKELVGSGYLATLREIYAAILTSQSRNGSSEPPGTSANEALRRSPPLRPMPNWPTSDKRRSWEQVLAETLRELWSGKAVRPTTDPFLVDARPREILYRALGTDGSRDRREPRHLLPAGHHRPEAAGHNGPTRRTQALFRTTVAAEALSSEGKVRLLMLDGLLRSNVAGVQDDLAAAYRGNTDGTLKGALHADIAAMIMTTGLYLSAVTPYRRRPIARTSALSITSTAPRWTMRSRFGR